jgi:hypothetical protein
VQVSKPFLVIAVCLALGLVYVLFFMEGKKPAPAVQAPVVTEPLPAVQKPSVAAETRKVTVRPAALAWKRDPFELPKAAERKAQSPTPVAVRLVAIMDGQTGRMAIIDNEVVRRGDMIAEEKVVDIGKDRVVLSRGKTQRVIVLEEGWQAQPAKQTNPGGVK